MSASQRLVLPSHQPDIASLNDVRGAEFLPFAIYNLASIPETDLDSPVAMINKDKIIGEGPNEVQLARRGPDSVIQQQALTGIIAAHIDYCTAQGDKLGYFPFGFLAAHHRNWKARGIHLVYIDFEEPFEVTGFRLAVDHVAAAANTLRDDDNGAEEIRDIYELCMTESSRGTASYRLECD